jgi:hypothetical protein
MLQLCLTLTGGAGLALQTGSDISRNMQEITTLENPLFVGPANVRFGSNAAIQPRSAQWLLGNGAFHSTRLFDRCPAKIGSGSSRSE